MRIFLGLAAVIAALSVANGHASSRPKDGTYILAFCQAEIPGGRCSGTCRVVIKGDRIEIYGVGDGLPKKDSLIERGILIRHKSGRWIVGKKPKDIDADPVGGCSGGPNTIDFVSKKYWTC